MTLLELPAAVEPGLPTGKPAEDEALPPAPGATVTSFASAFLAASSFGWLAGSVFAGPLARVVGLGGALLGVATVALSLRTRRPSLVQYGGAVVALLVGALLVVPDATGGRASLPGLVLEALRGGGLALPPVAFDPGWRFLLLVASALLAESAAGLALSLGRPRASAGVVLPFVIAAALLQPPGNEVSGTLVALLLLVASLVVSLGAETTEEGAGSAAFEARRLLRGLGAVVLLGGLLAGTAQLGFLFPKTSSERVIPPQRPQLPPPSPDRVLFSVQSPLPVTWRLGTLDVYRPPAWLTPPFDPARLVTLDQAGRVPAGARGETGGQLTGPTFTATFTLADLGAGKALPALAGVTQVRGGPRVQYDPRTQAIRVEGTRPRSGTTYRVTATVPPTGRDLIHSGEPGPAQREFLDVPPPPAAVSALLAHAPGDPFARLQEVRRAYYAHVVAAGSGKPVDVPPARVVSLLQGKPGTPYEITAGEVLLARWAGVPARIGYGYYGGQSKDGRTEIRPRNGATWLEAWFGGHGWVPIVGTPPQAQLSLNHDQQNAQPAVRPSNELALVTYVPVRRTTVRQLYVTVRYYALAALPFVLGGLLVLGLLPAAARWARRTLRARRARALGRQARVAAAYAELRDTATDLAIGNPALSPLELVDAVAPDPEHRELAWLVTRALWGDLARDLRDEDVEAAESWSRSVSRRLRTAQPGFTRAVAFVSRASLRRPWTDELPRVWPERGGRLSWRAATAGLVVVVLAAVVLSDLLRSSPAPLLGPPLPARIAPRSLEGLRFVPEPAAQRAYRTASRRSLAVDGRVFSLRQGSVVQGSLQVAGMARDVDLRSPRVRDQVLAGLGDGRFRPVRLGDEHVFLIQQPDQTLYLAFAPDGRSYSLLVTRAAFTGAERLFAALLAYRRGQGVSELAPDVPVPDPRRGSPT